MKKFLSLLTLSALLALATPAVHSAQAADYSIDPTHSSVSFTVRHLVSKVTGQFKTFDGTFSFDEKKLDASKANITIQTASVSTDNDKRDTHLKSADFFDVTKFPTITFKSKKITAAGDGKFTLVGEVTMHGVTHEETFALEYGGAVKDPWGNNRVGFTATAKLNRKDYGIVWNKTLDNGGYMLGDDVAVTLQIEATQAVAKK